MSKRPRDEATIASIKAVLGDIPTDVIENLLHRSNNNAEVAINLYFTDPPSATLQQQPTIVDSPSQPPATNTTTTNERVEQATRYYIGDLVITGWSLVKGRSPVKEGDTITIVRDKVGKSNNRIVRFAYKGREVGRLPKEIANYISVLMDQDLCQFTGSVVWSPLLLRTGEDMIITVKCYLSAAALHTASFVSAHIPPSKKKSNNEKRSLEVPVQRKIALLQMFRNLGLRPVRSAIQRMNVSGEDTWDSLLQSVTAKEEEEKSKTAQEDANNEDDEEKKAVTDAQLDTIYEKAQVFDSQIKPAEQPKTLALELKEYQKRALAWMSTKESYEDDGNGDVDMRSMHPLWEEYAFPGEFVDSHRFFYFNPYSGELSLEFPDSNKQERGGILADEMGLGKTIEILSLIHTNRFVPGSMPEQAACTRKSPTTLVVCPVSLLAQWRDEIIRGSKPGTITVEVFYGDMRSTATAGRLCRWDGTAPDVLVTTYGVVVSEWKGSQEKSGYKSPLLQVDFWRVVLDEAHQIKNKTTQMSQACRDIQARRRWAVTGTPIQNNLDDLYALVRYLHYEPWANSTFWKTFITIPFEKQDPRAISAVQSALEPIVLRRTKAMHDGQGQPMVPLPPKTVNIEYLSFSPQEQDIYDAIYNDSQIKFSYFCEAGQMGKNYASIFQLLTRLRQICCHPYLAIQSRDTLKEEITSSNGHGISLEDLIANRSSESMSQFSSQRSSSYGLSVLQNMLALEKGASSLSVNSSSPSTQDETQDKPEASDECRICFETSDAMIGLPCLHFGCRACIMDYFQRRENEGLAGECPFCRFGPIEQKQLLEFTQQKIASQDSPSTEKDAPISEPVRFDIQKVVGGFKPSTKMNALVRHLQQNRKEGLKTVVFSQFTSFLDLIGEGLKRESINYTRLDGSMSQPQREKVLASFADELGVDVLLISLRAGGVGLNLTCANRIIMMDPWWNFAVEAQAIDRVHRLGQTKDVTVTRFVMQNSVEERILEIQDRKHVLTNELYMSQNDSKNRKFDDLQILFGRGKKQ